MKTKTNLSSDTLLFEDLPKDYTSLCQIYLPRPIHNRKQFSEAEKVADILAGFEDRLSGDQVDYFDVITDFMAAYEDEPAPIVSPSEMLTFLMDQHSMSATDLARLLGVDRSQGARLVNGTRNLTVLQIMRLAVHFGVEPGVFIDSAIPQENKYWGVKKKVHSAIGTTIKGVGVTAVYLPHRQDEGAVPA